MRQCVERLGQAHNLHILPSCLLSLSLEYQDPIWEWTKVCNSITIIVAWSLASSHQTTEPHAFTIPLTNTHVCNKADEAAHSHNLETVRISPAHADQRALFQEPRCAPTHGIHDPPVSKQDGLRDVPCVICHASTCPPSLAQSFPIARVDAVQLARLPGFSPSAQAAGDALEPPRFHRAD
ncbi:hypothetical protein EDB86DRAFT_2239694 [Lactarius hatsudake]|nr:hypothetical protein EDB86DRAFT_2239694 [Lactarius hatsudake]